MLSGESVSDLRKSYFLLYKTVIRTYSRVSSVRTPHCLDIVTDVPDIEKKNCFDRIGNPDNQINREKKKKKGENRVCNEATRTAPFDMYGDYLR